MAKPKQDELMLRIIPALMNQLDPDAKPTKQTANRIVAEAQLWADEMLNAWPEAAPSKMTTKRTKGF